MNSISIPEILRGKLEFGNLEQIKAVREYERKLATVEDAEEASYFEVEVPISGTRIYHVRADNGAEAEAILSQSMGEDDDVEEVDEEIEVVWDCAQFIRKVSPCPPPIKSTRSARLLGERMSVAISCGIGRKSACYSPTILIAVTGSTASRTSPRRAGLPVSFVSARASSGSPEKRN